MPPPPGQWGPGQPPMPPQQPPPGYYPPQGGWGAPPPPPPKQNNTLKWLLAGVGVLLVIAITVGVTVLVTRDGSGGDGPSTTTSASGPPIASADDTGPVEIITVEPTCDSWRSLQGALAAVQANGWANRDPSTPATQWTAAVRTQYEAVGTTYKTVTQQAVSLAQQTPHRVMRELYEQFIAYGRAYADKLPSYVADDDYLVQTTIGLSSTIAAVCDAIERGGIAARAVEVEPAPAPTNVAPVSDPDEPSRFMEQRALQCIDWTQATDSFDADLRDWAKVDAYIPAAQWTPDARAQYAVAESKMPSYAAEIEQLGRESENAVLEDFASLASLYFRAFVETIPNYVAADVYIVNPGLVIRNMVISACQAAAG